MDCKTVLPVSMNTLKALMRMFSSIPSLEYEIRIYDCIDVTDDRKLLYSKLSALSLKP